MELGDELPPDPRGSGNAGRLVVAAFVLVAALVIGYFALGMPGMDMGDPAPREKPMDEMPGM